MPRLRSCAGLTAQQFELHASFVSYCDVVHGLSFSLPKGKGLTTMDDRTLCHCALVHSRRRRRTRTERCTVAVPGCAALEGSYSCTAEFLSTVCDYNAPLNASDFCVTFCELQLYPRSARTCMQHMVQLYMDIDRHADSIVLRPSLMVMPAACADLRSVEGVYVNCSKPPCAGVSTSNQI